MNTYTDDLLDECEKEQLHLSNAIQNYGVLLAVNANGEITHLSENVKSTFNQSDFSLLGQSIQNLLGENFSFDSGINFGGDNRRVIFGFQVKEYGTFDILVIPTNNGYLLELQPSVQVEHNARGSIGYISTIMSYSHPEGDDQQLLDHTLKTICELTGYEKAMIYQFQDDWSGEVIAESDVNNQFDKYMGLRFPAGDIPKIARDLYCKTPFRLIADAKAKTVPVISKKEANVLDLTFSDLRSVSPVHLEYLNNIHVGASLSFPIMLNNELWGLIALHNTESKYVSLETRTKCAEITTAFAMTIKARMTANRMIMIDGLDKKVSKILDKIDLSSESPNLKNAEDEIIDMTTSSSGAILLGDKIVPLGDAPDEKIIKAIDEWYQAKETKQTVSSDCLSEELPEAISWKKHVSGVMCIHSFLKTEPKGMRVYWYRPELPQEINWAGKPEKIINKPGSPIPISPRRSFDLWTEVCEGKSKAWSRGDIAAVAKFRAMVLKAVLR